ncbi:MAG: ribonuclease [Hyphomicrobiales bacterium]|nr:ribonuclease [Hyphomicrobiales bacterium]PCJ92779.1 MAG: ribonuclease [Hyphomicrobiales bacterium]
MFSIRTAKTATKCLVALIAVLLLTPLSAKEIRGARAGNFDFYVLSLSWSPSFCAGDGVALTNRQQCGPGRSFAFIVHGLWPQYKGGDWPVYCESSEPSRVPNDLARDTLDIMPSFGLIGHQWRKHGVCSGLSQSEYFALARAARKKIVVPPALRKLTRTVAVAPLQVEAAFSKFNNGLDPEEMGIACEDNRLQEIRVCMSKDLEFFACPAVDRLGCQRNRILMPPVR